MKYEKSCGSIVIKGDKVLIIKHNVGHIDFPKGHMEKGESEVETAIREVKEETGIDIEVDTNYRYMLNYMPKKGVSKDVILFLGKEVGGELKPQYEEVETTYYMPIPEALKRITYDNSREVLIQLLEDIKKD